MKTVSEALLLVESIEKSRVEFNQSKALIGSDIVETEKAIGTAAGGFVHSCARRCGSIVVSEPHQVHAKCLHAVAAELFKLRQLVVTCEIIPDAWPERTSRLLTK